MANTGVAKKTDNKNNQLSRMDFTTQIGETDIQSNEDIAKLMEKAKFVPVEELDELTGTYCKLEDGETYIFFCKGIAEKAMKSLKKDHAPGEEMTDAVELIDEKGNDVLNADIVLLSTARRLAANSKLPCFIRVYVDGFKGPKGGEYKNLVIHKVS